MIASFYAHLSFVGREQLNPETSDVQSYLLEYWADGFPPDSLVQWPLWLLDTQAGQMMAYPYGDSHGGSGLTLIMALIGSVVWWRTGRGRITHDDAGTVCAKPACSNLAQVSLWRLLSIIATSSPACCLLMGTGMAHVIERWSKSLTVRLWYARAWCCVLLFLGLAAIVYQAYRPYRDNDALWTRKVVRELTSKMQHTDQIMVTTGKMYGNALLWWNLGIQKYPVTWEGKINWESLEARGGRLWICDIQIGPTNSPRPRKEIEDRLIAGWRIVGMVSWFVMPGDGNIADAIRCDLYLCGSKEQHIEMPLFTQWPQP